MKEKINVIQFLPYFPPHKGGLETHSQEWGKWWVKKGYGNIYNIITDIAQEDNINSRIIFRGEDIGYLKDGCEILVLPSFEIINNFPVYKVWDKKYSLVIDYIREKNIDYVLTRTRFFFTSFIGGLFAKKSKIKWVHIEHGSDYVKLNSSIKNIVAKIYDKLIGKWIFKKADILFGVSNACRDFIQKGFVNNKVNVIYRGVELEKIKQEKKGNNLKIVFIGRLVKLKGVEDLIKAFNKISKDISLDIIGDGDEKNNLEKLSKNLGIANHVKFYGFKNKDFILNYLNDNNCIFINTSYQEGLPTSVIEALYYNNVVIASNVGGTSEISDLEDLNLFKVGDIDSLAYKIEFVKNNYFKIVGKSKETIINRFSWDRNIEKYYNLLKDE